MELLNPITIQFLLDEELFFFNEAVLPEKIGFHYGKNNKNIIFLSDTVFGIDDFELLYKILGALKLSIDDVALTDQDKYHTSDYIKEMGAKKIISFGKRLSDLSKEPEHTKYLVHKKDGIDWLEVESFNQYHHDASKKKLLWNSLNQLLN